MGWDWFGGLWWGGDSSFTEGKAAADAKVFVEFAGGEDEEQAFRGSVGGFAPRDLATWQGSDRALWAEVRAHVLGRVGEVELDRPAAARLEVDEPQPVLRPEHVAGVRLAVQQLLGGTAVDDRAPQAS